LLSFVKYCKISFSTGKDQNILINVDKLSAKISLNIAWFVEKGAF
jgi:hypothetical protein